MPEEEPFTDVADDDSGVDAITCLFQTGLTTGVTEDSYQPAATITRRQMVQFLVRLADEAEEGATGDHIAAQPAGARTTPLPHPGNNTTPVQPTADPPTQADTP